MLSAPSLTARSAAAAVHLRQAAAAAVTRVAAGRGLAAAAVMEEAAVVQASVSPAGLGRITLCRERQLNALGALQVEALQQQLTAWARPDSGVTAVLLDSCMPRAFCSGGDVKAARISVLEQPYSDQPPAAHHINRVFQAEYSTLLLTADYQLPLVAAAQGLWMGLGVGLAAFGRFRVVCDDTVFAMPECHIGLWPDVGFAFKAASMPGHLGLLLGLSGVRLSSAADLLHCGIATHFIPASSLQEFKQCLAAAPADVESLLQQFDQAGGLTPGPLQRLQPLLDRQLQQLLDSCSGGGADELALLRHLRQRLQAELPAVHERDHEAALLLQNVISGLAYGAPRSQVITLRHFGAVRQAVQAAAGGAGSAAHDNSSSSSGLNLSTLKGVMQMEYRMAVRQVAHHDFIEGVRAALVDKDRRPAWLLSSQQQQPVQPELHSVEAQQRQKAAAAAAASAPEQQQQQQQQEAGQPGNRFAVQQLFEPLSGGAGLLV